MQSYEIATLVAQRAATGGPWLEFLRTETLSVGLYELAAGSVDAQQPHTEDEVYYVLSGQGMISVADEEQRVQAGSVIFVGARAPHRFHSIVEDLSILVFFAPAEGSGVSQ